MNKPNEFMADLSLLFVAIIWGSTFIIVKAICRKYSRVFLFIHEVCIGRNIAYTHQYS